MIQTETKRKTGSSAVVGVLKRLEQSPSNTLPDEIYQQRIEAGWESQWLNWDDLGPDEDIPSGWGDVGD